MQRECDAGALPRMPTLGLHCLRDQAGKWNLLLRARMKTDIWYPFYPGDYQRDTQHLTTLEHGAYRLLIDACYCRGGSLPANDGDLARICRLQPHEWAEIRNRIADFFVTDTVTDTVTGAVTWTHKRVLRDLQHLKHRLQARSKQTEAARMTLKARKTPVTDTVTDPVTDTVTTSYPDPYSDPYSDPDPKAQSQSESHTGSVRGELLLDVPPNPTPEELAEKQLQENAGRIYEAYPRKVAKQVAIKAIAAALANKPYGELLVLTASFAEHCRKLKKEQRYIPHPATWFNQARYDDALEIGYSPESNEIQEPIRSAVIDIDQIPCKHNKIPQTTPSAPMPTTS
jgi:uncharacterized protein YdaU (DUF1376 family)